MKVQVLTSQNVEIEYEIASIGDRFLAVLLDILILVGYIWGAIMLMTLLEHTLFDSGFEFGMAVSVILFIPVFLYDFLCELFLDGQTFGKKIKKIKVIKMDGSQPGIASYFLRWLLKPFEVYFSYGSIAMITMLINGKGQRLGDIAGNTTVIRLKASVQLADTIFTAVEENYIPKFPEAAALTDDDVRIIKEVLDLGAKNIDRFAYDLILSKTKKAVLQKMGITSDMNSMLFLKVVLKDYNYVTGK